MRLGQGERTERLAGLHRGQPARALLVGPPRDHRVLGQDVDGERHRQGHVGGPELLHDQGPAEVAEAGPTDRLGERRRGQSELAHPAEDRPVESLRLVAIDRAGSNLALGELAGGRLDEALLVGQRPAQGDVSSGRLGGNPPRPVATVPGARIPACRTRVPARRRATIRRQEASLRSWSTAPSTTRPMPSSSPTPRLRGRRLEWGRRTAVRHLARGCGRQADRRAVRFIPRRRRPRGGARGPTCSQAGPRGAAVSSTDPGSAHAPGTPSSSTLS